MKIISLLFSVMKNKYIYHFWTLSSCTTMDFWYRSKGLFIASVKKLFDCSQCHICTGRMSGHPTWTLWYPSSSYTMACANPYLKFPIAATGAKWFVRLLWSRYPPSGCFLSCVMLIDDPYIFSSRFKAINQLIHLSLVHGPCSIFSNIELHHFSPQIITMI